MKKTIKLKKNYEFNNTYPLDWWNAPYKVESEDDE